MSAGLGRILLVSYYFAPQNAIGAVRPTKLAKYLTRMGYQVTVLCGTGMTSALDPTLQKDMAELYDVRVLREWNPLRWYRERKKPSVGSAEKPMESPAEKGDRKSGRPLHRLLDSVYLLLWVLSDRSFQRKAKRELGRLEGSFDAVFSSYAPLSVHEIAFAAKKRGLAQRWVADFRDEVNVSFPWMEGYQKRYMAMIRRHADGICAVSHGFLQMMGWSGEGRMLSNGFDPEDIAGLAPLPEERQGCFRLVYCGQLREGRKNVKNRDIRPAFRACKALVESGLLPEEKLKLVYAGEESAAFAAYARECGLARCVEDHGKVSRQTSLALQAGADALLMASWNLRGQTGILTGKLFEYMLMDKPIVCCMSGDLGNSELGRVLRQTGMGLCCEQADGPKAQAQLDAFFREMASRWQRALPLLNGKNEAQWSRYAYPALAKTLAGWLMGKEGESQ